MSNCLEFIIFQSVPLVSELLMRLERLNFKVFFHKVRRSSSVVSNVSTATASTTEENLTSSVENITDSIFVEASEAFNQNTARDEVDEPRSSDTELTEEEQIIREMDRDLSPAGSNENECTLRRRQTDGGQPEVQPSASTSSEANSQQNEEDKISIKLKYLNDEIKTVSAYLTETVGTFKR